MNDTEDRKSGTFPGQAAPEIAFIVCGALAREVIAIRDKRGWPAQVFGVPALLHNRPERIAQAVQKRITQLRSRFRRLIVVYGDCGTTGALDEMLAAESVERVAGPHCYEMYADGDFGTLMAEAPGTYFLTDYLVRSFDHLVIEGMGLDRFPELREDYFRHYTQIVYLALRDDPDLHEKARRAAAYLRLPLTIRPAHYGALERRLAVLVAKNGQPTPDGRQHWQER